ncbi:hypothetical protein G6011_05448 [Alternaria panax]|uniref:Gfd2/YDR514C-like C-terminal domain-containing protein n=1 Tax=Alternaria panax TaxID=48097 RepID=A0AAD4FD06_9PLEO|nr:hypothetical protein G6011_05448 [Alternaria panax]
MSFTSSSHVYAAFLYYVTDPSLFHDLKSTAWYFRVSQIPIVLSATQPLDRTLAIIHPASQYTQFGPSVSTFCVIRSKEFSTAGKMSGSQAYYMISNASLEQELQSKSAFEILGHFLGVPVATKCSRLDYAAVVCIDAEWWMKEPKPTTELGIAELMEKSMHPAVHAENFLSGIQVAHARVIEYAHLKNNFPGAGDPENFHFGKTKFVTLEEAKQVLIRTFAQQNEDASEIDLQPIIVVGHAVENDFDHLQDAFGVDLRSYGSIVKVVDTQVMAQELDIQGPRGPAIGLKDLLAHFNVEIPDLHTAGNDAAATVMAAVLLTLKRYIYPNVSGPPPAVIQGRNI